METRIGKLIVNKSGGTASAGGVTFRVTLPTNWVREMELSEEDRNVKLLFDGKEIKIINYVEGYKMREKLLKEIKEVAQEHDWLVVDDCYTNNHWVYGSDADYNNIEKGGGKFAIIDTDEIKENHILFNERYIKIEQLADKILEHWE